jgi:mannosyltransferase OCH1-like enzyme
MYFPRRIHQIWMQGEENIPEYGHESIKSWKDNHPGFDYTVWDENEIEKLLELRFPWFVDTWNSFDHMHQKVDTGRMAILYEYGGVAADMDSICKQSLEPLLKKYDDTNKSLLVAAFPFQNPMEHIAFQNLNLNRKLINNGIQVAKPKAKVLEAMLNKTKSKKEDKNYDGLGKMFEVAQVGGLSLMSNISNYDDYKDDIEILPYHFFEGQEAPDSKQNEVFVEHHWKATWAPKPIQKLVENLGAKNLKYTAYIVVLAAIAVLYVFSRWLRGTTFAGLVVMALIAFVVVVLITAMHGAFVSDYQGNKCTTNLNDRLYEIIPETCNDVAFTFFYNGPGVLFTLLAVFLFFKDFRMFIVLIVTFLTFLNIRTFTVQLTGVPSPGSKKGPHWALVEAFLESFKDKDTDVDGYTDMIFSGHTGTTFLSLLFFMLYMKLIDKWYARVILLLVMSFFMLGFVAIRIHYSVDIALGAVIALLIFGYARQFYEDPSIRFLGGSTFFRIFVASTFLAFASTSLSLFEK